MKVYIGYTINFVSSVLLLNRIGYHMGGYMVHYDHCMVVVASLPLLKAQMQILKSVNQQWRNNYCICKLNL